MTKIYFVRHAEPDLTTNRDDRTRTLTEKGRKDCALVTKYLQNKDISVVLSSPFRRSVDTVAPFAESQGLTIELIEDFRERKVDSVWIDDFNEFKRKQWEDFSYKLSDGECLNEVQERNIAALKEVLKQHKDKNIAVGTHGTALSMIINYYDNTYGLEDFNAMANIFPWMVMMEFEGDEFLGMEKVDLR